MSRSPRIRYSGAFYHICNRGVAKMDIVNDDQDRRTFFQLLSESVSRYEIRLYAYCLMTNHYHFYVQTPNANIDEFMWNLSYQYVRYFNHRYNRVGPLFQGRYKDRLVDSDEYSLSLVRYIHKNPVKARLCNHPQNYSWSSYGCYAGIIPKWPWLNTEWILKQFHPTNQAEAIDALKYFHRQEESDKVQKILENSNRPLAGKSFLARMLLTYRGQAT